MNIARPKIPPSIRLTLLRIALTTKQNSANHQNSERVARPPKSANFLVTQISTDSWNFMESLSWLVRRAVSPLDTGVHPRACTGRRVPPLKGSCAGALRPSPPAAGAGLDDPHVLRRAPPPRAA